MVEVLKAMSLLLTMPYRFGLPELECQLTISRMAGDRQKGGGYFKKLIDYSNSYSEWRIFCRRPGP